MLFICAVLGALIGWIAGRIMRKPQHFIKNMFFGVFGALIGGFVGLELGVRHTVLTSLLLSVGGACLLMLIFKKQD